MSGAGVALRAVEALRRELESDDRFSGVVGIEQGEQTLLLDAFGYASRTWSIPATLETRFDTASITKLFTAVATLQLVEQGAFALDTSVVGYLGLEDTGISSEVTPYHLLTHTSASPTTPTRRRANGTRISSSSGPTTGMLRHYPLQDISVAVLAVGQNAAWAPIKAVDEAVGNVRV
jgi:CubicO group peptidase (beta-lactamase class C family)